MNEDVKTADDTKEGRTQEMIKVEEGVEGQGEVL